ncbi:armadillo-type protein [Flammula alnicola]|nr:armadillo-type protein [Flammula alnicola]
MPRENRKRGKKHKKQNEEEPQYKEAYVEPQVESPAEPSWIVPAPAQVEEDNPEAPFGYVDVDVKAYFRTVDVQIRDWQDIQEESAGVDGDVDPNEHKRLFFTAALQEMQGKEKQLATDPDCSVILERMSYSMDDFVDGYEGLVRHRFRLASKATISRETKAIMPAIPESEEQGELRTLTQLVLDICKELLPTFPSLIMDPSHPTSSQSAVRSKKSAAWKARQGQMKSVFEEDKGKGKEAMRSAPAEFRQMARRLVEVVKEQLGENETRAMAANKVACPGLQVIHFVAIDDYILTLFIRYMSNQPGSLMDRVMVGVITACLQDPPSRVDESDYLGTLLRDPNSSHLLEIIVIQCNVETYFKGKLARLAAHPVANFVLAKAVERVSEHQLSDIFGELDGTWNKLIRQNLKTGVLRAIVDRTSALKLPGQQIIEVRFSDSALGPNYDQLLYTEYSAAVANHPTHKQPPSQQHNSHRQGSVLLQSLLRLPQPLNQFFTDSIYSLPVEERIKIAHNPSGSRVFDALLDSTTVPAKVKRQFVMDFIGHYHLLVDDKLGSRVGDRCWAFCDTYLKEKIARSLVNQEQTLAASYYGKFFARNLNLYLLQRRPEDWRNLQSERKRAQDQQQQQRQTTAPVPDHNEIDALFDAKLGKRIKKAALVDVVPVSEAPVEELQQVLGAIRVAPANDGKKKRRN